jgi:predicted nucleotidyltransferase
MQTTKAKKKQYQQVVREFHQRIEDALGQPVQVVLFGSCARGTATEDSDVDVLVVVSHLDARTEDIIGDIAWEVGFETGLVFSAIPLSEQQLSLLRHSPWFQSVQREGIPL